MTERREGADTAPAGKSWLKWVLIGSLAVNFLILGSALGHRFLGQHGPWRGARGGEEFGIMGYVRTLEADRRTVIRKVVQADRPLMKSHQEALRQARIAATETLAADPFDKEKVRAAFARIAESDARLKASGLETILNAAEQMTPAERIGLVEWWKKRRPHHFREPRGGDRRRDRGEVQD